MQLMEKNGLLTQEVYGFQNSTELKLDKIAVLSNQISNQAANDFGKVMLGISQIKYIPSSNKKINQWINVLPQNPILKGLYYSVVDML